MVNIKGKQGTEFQFILKCVKFQQQKVPVVVLALITMYSTPPHHTTFSRREMPNSFLH